VINAFLTSVTPYPGTVLQLPDSSRRHHTDDMRDIAVSDESAARKAVQPVTAVPDIESSISYKNTRQKINLDRILDRFNGKDQSILVTSADVLMRMINEMGGTGIFNGPGQLFDVTV